MNRHRKTAPKEREKEILIDERYRHFMAAARTLHFTRAGEEVYRTQSAISQSVGALESELGVDLFFREGRRLRLTPAGERLRRACADADLVAKSCWTDLRDLGDLEVGTLRIGASSTNACYLLPPLVAEFRSRYPGIELKIVNGSSSQLVEAILEGSCDLAFVTLPVPGDRLFVRDLGPREDVLAAAPGSAHLKRRPPVLGDLAGLPFIFPHPQAQSRAFLDRIFRDRGIRVQKALEVRGIEIIKRYVEADFGLSILPALAVSREVEAGRLEVWSVFDATERRRLALVQARRDNPAKLNQAFEKVLDDLGVG